jgi:FkbH-like protein
MMRIKKEKIVKPTLSEHSEPEKKIKCVVWDLDNTLWKGVLLENNHVSLRDNIVDIIKTLDQRGILQSIASKNEYNHAMAKIKEFGLDEFFLYPQIHWNTKVTSLSKIAESLNIGIDSIAFIDDQPFELEEVAFSLPDVLCIHAAHIDKLPDMPEMNPRFITDDSKHRRQMYVSAFKRDKIENEFEGPKEEFLATLGMKLTIAKAKKEDLKRAEELTVRTHQLNTTGYTYSYEELNGFLASDSHLLFVSSLEDKYGTYGTIGLTLIECHEKIWNIKLLIMSCRVMSRGVGTTMIDFIRKEAKKRGVRLIAELIPTDRNRAMYMTYKFSHFKEIEKTEGRVIFENDYTTVPDFLDYMTVFIDIEE